MPGLPLGAAQQHEIPRDALCYERIESIEFIEIDPDRPYPRSVAYRPIAGGGQLRARDWGPDYVDVDLDEEAARDYIESLLQSGLFAWHRVYRPAQGTFVVASVEWRLSVEFSTPKGQKRVHAFKSEGEGIFPDTYQRITEALAAPAADALAELERAAAQAEAEDEGGAQ